nr:hypothetical protein [Escherichia coli]
MVIAFFFSIEKNINQNTVDLYHISNYGNCCIDSFQDRIATIDGGIEQIDRVKFLMNFSILQQIGLGGSSLLVQKHLPSLTSFLC